MNYSIIIPHKNVPMLLERLLASIPIRNDTEIIIVDDHSDSEDIDFDSFPGIHRPNTKVVFLKEGKRGAGYARNIGISKAVGKWLLFADADDFYTDQLNNLLDKFKDDDYTDIVYLNAQIYCEKDGTTHSMYLNKYFDRYKQKKFYAEKVLRFNVWTPWTRMVKRDLVYSHNIKYEEIPVGNDKMFCLKCSQYAKHIDIHKDIVYNYYMSKNGSITFGYSQIKDNFRSGLELKFRVNQLYSEVGFAFKQSYLYPYLRKKAHPDSARYCINFMKTHGISKTKDMYYALLYITGKLLNII